MRRDSRTSSIFKEKEPIIPLYKTIVRSHISADYVGATGVNMFKDKIDIYLRRAGYRTTIPCWPSSTCALHLVYFIFYRFNGFVLLEFVIACVPVCLGVPCAYTCVASVGHIHDYVEGHLCGEFCDVVMYTMSIYKQTIIM